MSAIKPLEASEHHYDGVKYLRCGKSGVQLPTVSLGLWHNFGHGDDQKATRQIVKDAFNMGITHFDLANNYGPPYGSAEENFGATLKKNIKLYRDERFISTKAGYDMWSGPYGNWGSKKYLVASIDQSFHRMGLEYVDVFYHHRPDPDTPIYQISNYPPDAAKEAFTILDELDTPCLLHQIKFSMFNREPREELLDILRIFWVGGIAFSPLAQGMLTSKYLNKIPEYFRAAKPGTYLEKNTIEENKSKIKALNEVVISEGKKLSTLALQWVLSHAEISSVLIGVSSSEQHERKYGNHKYGSDYQRGNRKIRENFELTND